MIKLVSLILDLVAPKAKAEIEHELTAVDFVYSDLVDKICSKYKVLSRNSESVVVRVKGDFFSDLRAVQVIVGKQANQGHYSKVGFNLEIKDIGKSKILVKAEERVILGYLETNAISSVLAMKLDLLIETIRQ